MGGLRPRMTWRIYLTLGILAASFALLMGAFIYFVSDQ